MFLDECTSPVAVSDGCHHNARLTNVVIIQPDFLYPNSACGGSITVTPAAPGRGPSEYIIPYELLSPETPDLSPEDNTGQISLIVPPWRPTVEFVTRNVEVAENDGHVELLVQRSSPPLCAWSAVEYMTEGLTAIEGLNFAPSRGSVFFTNGQSRATLRIPILHDGLTSEHLMFTVRLLGAAGNLTLGEGITATVQIRDVDDVVQGWIEPVSVLDTNAAPTGDTANSSHSPLITANGQFVFFTSTAGGLVAGITNGTPQNIYRRDLSRKSTELASCGADGTSAANSDCWLPVMSSNGEWLAFTSQATNLSSVATHRQLIGYLRDMRQRITHIVSLNTNNVPTEGWIYSVSDDGRFVVFGSSAADVSTNKFNNSHDLFLRDRWAGMTHLLSADANGQSPATRSTNLLVYSPLWQIDSCSSTAMLPTSCRTTSTRRRMSSFTIW